MDLSQTKMMVSKQWQHRRVAVCGFDGITAGQDVVLGAALQPGGFFSAYFCCSPKADFYDLW